MSITSMVLLTTFLHIRTEEVLGLLGRVVEIAPHTTVDATYTYSWDDFNMSFSVYNLTDELPPFTYWEMSYDPNTHSPLGRFIKVGFTYNMQ